MTDAIEALIDLAGPPLLIAQELLCLLHAVAGLIVLPDLVEASIADPAAIRLAPRAAREQRQHREQCQKRGDAVNHAVK
jgi:hypothetical protein